nr:ATP-dependent helicase [Phytoactinopolyspora mesophila]
MGELLGVGSKSKKVRREIAGLTAVHGPELAILADVALDDLETASPQLAEAVRRLRQGEVIREAGYDGEYGTIRLFDPAELRTVRNWQAPALFDDAPIRAEPNRPRRSAPAGTPAQPTLEVLSEPGAEVGAERDTQEISDTTPALLAGLDPDQRAAAAVRSGPLLIIAGPGTGKTRTLTHRIAYMVNDHQVPPEQCLAITFTRKAAAEMSERLGRLIGERADDVTVTTFHAFGLSVLRAEHARVGLTASFGIADDERRLAVLADVLGDAAAARGMVSELSRVRRSPQPVDPEVTKALDAYLTKLRELNLVDFDDLVALPVDLLESDPALSAEFRARYSWICVDEYQDVDALQYRLLRMLAPAGGNVTAIGDPDQAIYRFRGADVGFFLRFEQDFPSAEVVHLTRNYRSGPHILSGAMQVVRPSTLVPDRVLSAAGGHADPARIGVYPAASDRTEAAFVSRTIDQLLGGTSLHSRDSGRVDDDGEDQIGFGDIAVLYRTSGQAGAVMDALTRAGYPFQRHSHDRLVERPGVRTLLDELTYATEARTAPDVYTALQSVAEVTSQRVSRLNRTERTSELYVAVDLLTPLAVECGDDLERFRRELLLGAEVDALDPRADRISLLTLHAAKGLEFPVVFMVGCENGLLPLRWPGEEPDDEQLAEERRLFFVGMTRAQRLLYLSHAAQRIWRGQLRENGPSPFLRALNSSIVERIDAETANRRQRAQQLTLM